MKLQKTSSRLTQILCLALAAVMLVMTLAGCGSESPAAIIVGDVRISSNMFCYWMSRYKAMFLYAYFGTTTDNSQYWTARARRRRDRRGLPRGARHLEHQIERRLPEAL